MIAQMTAPPSRPAERVLLVEDHRGSAQSIARLLSHFGYVVRVERDGAEAVRAAGEFAPSVALIDLSLPTLDGCDVAKRLRESPTTRGTRLIAMTGWDDEEHRQRALAAGFDHHLVKPIGVNVLINALAPTGQSAADLPEIPG